MAFIARQTDFHAAIESYRPVVATSAAPRKGLLARLYDAIMDGRQRRAQRDIDRYVATHGRRMTDSLEREINARLLGDGWNVRR